MRQNTANTTVTWADIDTGAEAASTTYYVYAVADADATTATFMVSANSSTPTGATYYKKIGSFYNDSSSNIDRTKVYTIPYGNLTGDSEGKGLVTDVRDYGTSASSYTAKTGGDLKLAYGRLTVAGSSCTSLSNLPFTSSATYSIGVAITTGPLPNQDCYASPSSGSAASICNAHNDSRTIMWTAIGY